MTNSGLHTMQTAKEKILRRIRQQKPGKAFMAKDFLDVASRGMVDVTLSTLTREGVIRRVRRGLYDLPKDNPALGGALSPDINQAAQAIARRHRWKIVPAGAWAANLLGLSTQVPAKVVYLSDGPSKRIQIGKQTIQFKHARPQAFVVDEPLPALVVQALRHLGKDHVDDAVIKRLRKTLSVSDKRQLLKAMRFGPDWIYATAKAIAEAT
jgi:Family of unknown function (DUF6088)